MYATALKVEAVVASVCVIFTFRPPTLLHTFSKDFRRSSDEILPLAKLPTKTVVLLSVDRPQDEVVEVQDSAPKVIEIRLLYFQERNGQNILIPLDDAIFPPLRFPPPSVFQKNCDP